MSRRLSAGKPDEPLKFNFRESHANERLKPQTSKYLTLDLKAFQGRSLNKETWLTVFTQFHPQ